MELLELWLPVDPRDVDRKLSACGRDDHIHGQPGPSKSAYQDKKSCCEVKKRALIDLGTADMVLVLK